MSSVTGDTSSSAAVALGHSVVVSVVVLGNAPRTDHLHVLVHHASRAGGVAHLDQCGELLVDAENAPRHHRRERRIAQRPRYVLQRDELNHEHAIVRGFGDGEMELAPEPGEGGNIRDRPLGLGIERVQPGVIRRGAMDGGKLGGESSCTASASANRRGLPCAMRAPPPAPTLISTMPSASSVRSASRATIRLTPKRSARSFSVPRKSPGRISLANKASRTCVMIRADKVGPRKARTSPRLMAGCRRVLILRLGYRAQPGNMIKISSFKYARQMHILPRAGHVDLGLVIEGSRFQKEKPRAVPGAFRSNPPIKSVKGTYAGVLLLRNFQMRSGPRIWPGVAFEPLFESTRQGASRTTKTASQTMRAP